VSKLRIGEHITTNGYARNLETREEVQVLPSNSNETILIQDHVTISIVDRVTNKVDANETRVYDNTAV
jgi:hypothetical protein